MASSTEGPPFALPNWKTQMSVLLTLPPREYRQQKSAYRNWINSMGLRTVVHSLYGDLFSGTVIFKLYDLIKSGSVDWLRVNRFFSTGLAKANFQHLENCNYMVELGQRAGFSLVGVAGSDLKDRKMTPILALLWQLMRAYTLSLLVKLAERTEGTDTMGYHRARSPVSNMPIISERGIIDWVNGRLAGANKPRRISVGAGFSDFELRNGLLIIDLLDAISPGCVDYSVVNKGLTPAERLSNAQYAVTVARRIGAKIYAVPEDITEVKPRMLMTVFACIMAIDLEKNHKVVIPKKSSPSPTRMSSVTINEVTRSPSPSGENCTSTSLSICQMAYQDSPKSGYQRLVDTNTLAEKRATMNRVETQMSTLRVESYMVKNNPLTVDIGKVQYAEKGTYYDPPQRRFFGSPPPPRSRHAELFSSPRLYRSELTKSTTALDQIGKLSYTGGGEAPQDYRPVGKALQKFTKDKGTQCEATTWKAGVPEVWNRDSKKSDIFAASLRDVGGSIRTAPNGVGRNSRMDGVTLPQRRGFAAAYGEYASKTVQANRQGGSGIRRGGGGRVFMAADIHHDY
ncbi:Plastin-3 [Echinococcus granulosus]|uniref:Plastin-3 n=1 Tax=Echinococcus granulosus TaxID=6210 RepID=W6V1A8_ECHGR|nr:Plastin-3 [Echinococcus granulosus]EUB59634.1 Plastin-3 [Echinococcus granulosus]